MLISTNSGLYSARKKQERIPMVKAMSFFAEAGFEAVDVNLSAVIYEDPYKHESILDGNWKEKIDEIKRVISDTGMKISMSHLPFYPYTMDDKERLAYCNQMMARAIEAVAYIGAPYTVIHPYRDPTTHMTDTEGSIKVLGPWVKMGSEMGVTLCVENMKETAAEQLREIATALDSGICWDVGHANLCGLDQYKSIITLGNRLKVLHLHDNYGTKDDHSLPFLGTVDWQGIMNGLREVGYNGVFNYEVQATALPEELRMEHARYLIKAAKIIMAL